MNALRKFFSCDFDNFFKIVAWGLKVYATLTLIFIVLILIFEI